MSPRVTVIAAVASNRVIGRDNTLPWHLPEDLKRFRALTMGHPIVMGRKTFESLGRLLPGRTSVIVSRNPDYRVPGAIVVTSLQEAFSACARESEVFVIGGAELYREAIGSADRLCLTEIEAAYDGDTLFPAVDPARWREVARESHVSASGLPFSYVEYQASATPAS